MEIKFPNPKGMLIAVRFPMEAGAIPFTINTLSLSQIQKAVYAVDGFGEVWVNELSFERENNIVFLGMFVQVKSEGHQLIPPVAMVEDDLRNSLAKCGAFPKLEEVAVKFL